MRRTASSVIALRSDGTLLNGIHLFRRVATRRRNRSSPLTCQLCFQVRVGRAQLMKPMPSLDLSDAGAIPGSYFLGCDTETGGAQNGAPSSHLSCVRRTRRPSDN